MVQQWKALMEDSRKLVLIQVQSSQTLKPRISLRLNLKQTNISVLLFCNATKLKSNRRLIFHLKIKKILSKHL
jgi:hypothetical protein